MRRDGNSVQRIGLRLRCGQATFLPGFLKKRSPVQCPVSNISVTLGTGKWLMRGEQSSHPCSPPQTLQALPSEAHDAEVSVIIFLLDFPTGLLMSRAAPSGGVRSWVEENLLGVNVNIQVQRPQKTLQRSLSTDTLYCDTCTFKTYFQCHQGYKVEESKENFIKSFGCITALKTLGNQDLLNTEKMGYTY